MESLELKNNICRACLEQTAILNWNDEVLDFCGITYKDCYYKYTQLKILVIDPYPQMLCQTCSNDFKTSHTLVTKALESYTILQQTYTPVENQIIFSEDNEDTKDNIESFSDHKYEPKIEPDEFEMLLFHQDEEALLENNNDAKECTDAISKLETNESPPEKRKRRAATKTKKSSNTDLQPSSALTSQDEPIINCILDKEEKTAEEDVSSDDKDFDSISDNETLVKKIRKIKKQNKKVKSKVKKKKKESKPVDENETDDSRDAPPAVVGPKEKKVYTYPKKKLMCSICSKIYSGKTSLLRHEESHNEQRERLEVCPHCGIKFFNKRCLYLHLKIHNKDREKKYKCEFCSKAYYNMGALNVHRRVHLGQMVPCPICSKEFHRQVDLDRHNIVAHSEVPITTDVKKKSKYYVFCKDCNKHLLTTSWKAHEAAHLKEPLMKCSICNKDFFNRDTCRYHMQKTHNYKTREEYEQYIIYCKPNRLSHLLLEQHDIIQANKT